MRLLNDIDFSKLLGGKKVLVAEDNSVNQILIEHVLNSVGVFPTIVNNGKEALRNLNNGESFDVILMDLQMPIMDGFQASEEILLQQNELRQLFSYSFAQHENDNFFEMNCCEIIALTSYSDKETKDRCIQIGMKEVLNKPI